MKTTRRLTSTFSSRFDMLGTLKGERPSGAHPEPLRRIARGVAIAIGISLFMPSAHAPALNITPKEYAYHALQQNTTQYKCLATLWGKESAWRPHAVSYDGSAYGIPQMRNKKLIGMDANTQVIWGLRYIKHRYVTPCAALRHWRVNGNY